MRRQSRARNQSRARSQSRAQSRAKQIQKFRRRAQSRTQSQEQSPKKFRRQAQSRAKSQTQRAQKFRRRAESRAQSQAQSPRRRQTPSPSGTRLNQQRVRGVKPRVRGVKPRARGVKPRLEQQRQSRPRRTRAAQKHLRRGPGYRWRVTSRATSTQHTLPRAALAGSGKIDGGGAVRCHTQTPLRIKRKHGLGARTALAFACCAPLTRDMQRVRRSAKARQV